MKHAIHARHGFLHAIQLPHVPNIKLEICITILMPHVILLFLIAGKDANLGDISFQELAKNGIAEAACAAGD